MWLAVCGGEGHELSCGALVPWTRLNTWQKVSCSVLYECMSSLIGCYLSLKKRHVASWLMGAVTRRVSGGNKDITWLNSLLQWLT